MSNVIHPAIDPDRSLVGQEFPAPHDDHGRLVRITNLGLPSTYVAQGDDGLVVESSISVFGKILSKATGEPTSKTVWVRFPIDAVPAADRQALYEVMLAERRKVQDTYEEAMDRLDVMRGVLTGRGVALHRQQAMIAAEAARLAELEELRAQRRAEREAEQARRDATRLDD